MNAEGQVVFAEKEGQAMFAIEFGFNKRFDEGCNVIFYFADYSYRHHSSLHHDKTLKDDAVSVRFAFYLTATMACWAAHIRTLPKNKQKEILVKILSSGDNPLKIALK